MSPLPAIVRRRLLLGFAALAVLLTPAVGYVALPGLGEALAYMLPPLLLLTVLVLRRYPGERALLTLMRPHRRSRLRVRTRALALRQRPRVVVPRGGDLLARSLAVRPPPLAVVVPRSC